ncbi:MAG: replication-relaxation family protein [Anaerolineae bacterium]
MRTIRTNTPRHLRVMNPLPMRLTARDVQVLKAVHDYRVLSREQIQRLLFPSQNTTNYRLQRLYQHGFLDRRWRPVEYGQGMGQAIYLSRKKGINILAQHLTVSPEHLHHQSTSRTARSPFLEHTLQVNDVCIAFALAVQRAGYQIERWLREDELRAAREYVYMTTNSGTPRQVAIIPDSYLALRLGDRRAHFLLEIDRSTETSGRWVHRVQAYLAYIASGQYSRRFGTNSLRILVITTSQERLANLLHATEKAGGGSVFWFTTLELAQSGAVLTEPIWQVVGQEGMSKLIADSSRERRTGELENPTPSV